MASAFETFEEAVALGKASLRVSSPGPSLQSTAASETWSDDEAFVGSEESERAPRDPWQQVSKRTAEALKRFIAEDDSDEDDEEVERAATRMAVCARRLAMGAGMPRAPCCRSQDKDRVKEEEEAEKVAVAARIAERARSFAMETRASDEEIMESQAAWRQVSERLAVTFARMADEVDSGDDEWP